MTRYIITLLLSLMAMAATAQVCGGQRYQARVFALTVKTSDVVYGNAPSLPAVYLSENITQNIDLKMDVWQPMGDTLQRRPLVILAFGGAFLIGSKEDEDMRTIADSLAHRGYVTASINYRLGMNVVNGNSAERAIYRAMQDYSAAVRYFKEYADLYRIDTNYIYAGGVSAGGFAAMHMALVDESDRPASSFGAGGFNLRPDLGCKDCSGNSFAHSSNVRGLINYWGAIGDVNWIKPGRTVPLLSIHGDQDLIVPYNTGFPFTALFVLPQVSGSGSIKQRYDQIGGYNLHYPIAGEGHNTWGPIILNEFTPGPNQYFQQFYSYTADFLFDLTKPNKPQISGNDSVCPEVLATYSVAALPGYQYCWQVDGGQIATNGNNSVEILWTSPGLGSLYVTPISHLDAVGEADTFAVWVHTPVLANVYVVDNDSVCEGGSLALSANNAYYAQWSPASSFSADTGTMVLVIPPSSGYYYLQATDTNGCLSEDSIYITVMPIPAAPTIQQLGDTLYTSTNADSLTWYDADTNQIASGSSLVPITAGYYYANETSTFGCIGPLAEYLYIEVPDTTDTTDTTGTGVYIATSNGLNVYPNPFNDRVVLESGEGGTFTLYDISGQMIYHTQFLSGNVNISLSHFASGLYFYKIATPTGIFGSKILKQ